MARSESKQGGAEGLGRAVQQRAARSAEVQRCGTRRDLPLQMSQRCGPTCSCSTLRPLGGVDPLEWRNCALHTNARACVVKRAWSWMVVVAVDSDASYQDEDESEDEDDDEDDDAHLDP